MPESVEVNMENLEKNVKQRIKASKTEIIPIAFGLKSLVIVKVIPEKDREMERIEKEIRSIPDVKEVEVTNVARSW